MSKQEESVSISGVVEARFGWNAFPRQRSGGLIGGLFDNEVSVDCDARAVFCKKDGSPISSKVEDCCLYYGNMNMFDGAAVHQGDNQTGGNGDDEIIVLDLNKLPTQVGQIILTLDLFKERKRIGNERIQEVFVRIVDKESNCEIDRVDVSHIHSGSKMIVLGAFQRNGTWWQLMKEGTQFRIGETNDYIEAITVNRKQ